MRGCSSGNVMERRCPRRARKCPAYAPRIITIKIKPDKIRDVIGPGLGTVIRGLVEETGCKIDVGDDGTASGIPEGNEFCLCRPYASVESATTAIWRFGGLSGSRSRQAAVAAVGSAAEGRRFEQRTAVNAAEAGDPPSVGDAWTARQAAGRAMAGIAEGRRLWRILYAESPFGADQNRALRPYRSVAAGGIRMTARAGPCTSTRPSTWRAGCFSPAPHRAAF